MAKVIEFYVPKNFRKPLKYATALYCGKIIEFGAPSKKSHDICDPREDSSLAAQRPSPQQEHNRREAIWDVDLCSAR